MVDSNSTWTSRLGRLVEKRITLTGISCKTCSEDKAMHNTCRNRACTSQLRSKNF